MRLYAQADETIESVGKTVRAGGRTFVDVLQACLARIDEQEPRIKAWVVVDREKALATARELDRELAKGNDRGPLHGIPLGVKDIIDVAGLPTAAGAKQWATGPASEDAPIVAELRKAGAVILGKTVTTAYAWIDPPPTCNPWNSDRTPGGSSSGSAAAVASGMCLLALGTQTGGSLTRPASFCGVSSFKPPDGSKYGRGIVPFARSLDTPGLMARSVGDLWLAWGVLQPTEEKPGKSLSARTQALKRVETIQRKVALGGNPAPLTFAPERPPKLARLCGFFQDLSEPAMRVVFESSLVDLAKAGAEVAEIPMPEGFEGVRRHHRIVMAAEAAAFHTERIARLPEDYPPKIRSLVEEGLAIKAVDYVHALEVRRELSEAIEQTFEKAHAIAVPATLGPAPDRSTTGDSSFQAPWTFTRSPTVSFPIGLSADGLPMAIQLVGARSDLKSLLGVASWCEQIIRGKRS
jgi:Asp-tRNA(Asn)/Glu-tRNA(Gln) amidotransferase A subunit family amidase